HGQRGADEERREAARDHRPGLERRALDLDLEPFQHGRRDPAVDAVHGVIEAILGLDQLARSPADGCEATQEALVHGGVDPDGEDAQALQPVGDAREIWSSFPTWPSVTSTTIRSLPVAFRSR